ncbi:MAG: UDP-glucose/GDP-mannose dehydrogenase family protein [Bacteroidetes bacterium]|nr:UDP-glucose/GDP-mannose dehydrogenase family protein [Bacteroidota bacterium]
MNISIFGLGYVGCVGMGCLAQNGHKLIGVDTIPIKVDLINQGKATIVEKDIDRIILEQYSKGNISATMDYRKAVHETDISILCVGTPSTPQGHLNLDYIYQTAEQLGESLRDKDSFHIVAIRSTVLPGTNARVGEIIEKASGKKRNEGFAVVSNPEFLREGTAVEDYFNPPLTVLGSDNEKALDIMAGIYSKVNGPIEKVDIRVAELIKYINNSYHALKIVFANEVGNVCKNLGIDSHEVMRIFCMDKQLNISPYYFKPGFAYGGSCLPKDLKALKTLAHDNYLETPVLNSIEASNDIQKQLALNLIKSSPANKVGILGLSFKSGTDDLRYSPIIEVIEWLYGKGSEIRIYDKNVILSRLVGKNKSFIEEKLPHISQMLSENLDEVVSWAEVLVITNKEDEFLALKPKPGQRIIDLARLDSLKGLENYEGLCW